LRYEIIQDNEWYCYEKSDSFYLIQNENWDSFINDDHLIGKIDDLILVLKKRDKTILENLLPPIGGQQELWACGVTYLRSKIGRQEESKASGGADFYGKVYEAERPEVFFKSTPHRIVGHNAFVRIRKDSTWDVPEPELTLVVTSSGKIIGYTIGNDMSSRSIEGEKTLYIFHKQKLMMVVRHLDLVFMLQINHLITPRRYLLQ
jgi:2-dehydro-3-deoxy-D-arabinonate dehydratase